MLSRLASVLDGVVMGFMALAALGLGVAPLLFELPSHAERGFAAAGWLIIALFALEYIAHFAVAADRRRFAFDPWRMLDLQTRPVDRQGRPVAPARPARFARQRTAYATGAWS